MKQLSLFLLVLFIISINQIKSQQILTAPVGIGTNTPAFLLDVHGTGTVANFGNGTTGGIKIGDGFISKSAGAGWVWGSGLVPDGDNVRYLGNIYNRWGEMQVGNAAPSQISGMRFATDGKVGIGTTSPEAQLHLSSIGGGNSGVRISSVASSSFSNLMLVNDQSDESRIYLTGSAFPAVAPYRPNQMGINTTGAGGITIDAEHSSGIIRFGAGVNGADNERMRITNSGQVGIGTPSPSYLLDVYNTGIVASFGNGTTGGIRIGDGLISKSAGSGWVWGSGMVPDSDNGRYFGDVQSRWGMVHIGNAAYSQISGVRFATDGSVGIGTLSPTAKFHNLGTVRLEGLPNDNTASQILVTDNNGNVSWRDAATLGGSGGGTSNWTISGTNIYNLNQGSVTIGTAVLPDPDAKLAVKGNIYAMKVRVTQSGWSDYVFDEDYKLRTLNEVEKFIRKNHHLPEVPSAVEVEKNGLDLGDNQATLLKKIEELTLYLIEQNKRLQDQQQQINALRVELKQQSTETK